MKHFYLKEIERGESFPVVIDRLCFQPGGALRNEYQDLYYSLFTNAEAHVEDGCQIDMLIDRRDDTINLCEMKFRKESFSIDKAYKKKLAYKRDCFMNYTKTTKQVFVTMITNQPVIENEHFQEVVDATVLLEDIFK